MEILSDKELYTVNIMPSLQVQKYASNILQDMWKSRRQRAEFKKY